MSDVVAVCNSGHRFVLKDFEPDENVIACISWCIEMVAKKEHFGLVVECGDKVLWIKNLPKDKPVKRLKFRKDVQLDLFDDNVVETKDLTNVEDSDRFNSEGHS